MYRIPCSIPNTYRLGVVAHASSKYLRDRGRRIRNQVLLGYMEVWGQPGIFETLSFTTKKKKKKGGREKKEERKPNIEEIEWYKWLDIENDFICPSVCLFLFPTVPLCTTKKRWLWVLRRTVDGYWTPLHCSYKYSGRSRMPYTTQGALEAFLGLGSSVFWLQQYLLCTDELSYVDNLG